MSATMNWGNQHFTLKLHGILWHYYLLYSSPGTFSETIFSSVLSAPYVLSDGPDILSVTAHSASNIHRQAPNLNATACSNRSPFNRKQIFPKRMNISLVLASMLSVPKPNEHTLFDISTSTICRTLASFFTSAPQFTKRAIADTTKNGLSFLFTSTRYPGLSLTQCTKHCDQSHAATSEFIEELLTRIWRRNLMLFILI